LQRLGAKLDSNEVKNHPYFKDINWTDVYQKYNLIDNYRKLNAPIPTLKSINMENFKPKIFDDNKCCGKFDYRMEHFDGWSFVNSLEENK
jgi:hypothetical protein